MSKTISPELLQGLAAEATGLLVRIAANVEQVRLQPGLAGHLEEARRAAHQAKGAASMIGLAALAHVFFYMEEALEELRAGRSAWSDGVADVFEACVLELGECLSKLSHGEMPARILSPDVEEALQSLRGAPAPSAPVAAATPVAPVVVVDTGASIPAELLEVFRMEAEEHLTHIGESLAALEGQPGNQDLLLEVRRSVHTLKGASGSVGFRELSRLSHRMEDLLDRLSESRDPLASGDRSLLVSTFDALCDLAAGGHDPASLGERIASLYRRYDELEGSAAAAADAEPARPSSATETTPGLSAELIASFRQETEERLQSVQEQLRMLEAAPEDAGLALAIRRTIHTIKGASAMVGHAPMSRLAHRMEDLLGAFAEGAVAYGEESKNLLYLGADALSDLAAGAGSQPGYASALEEIEELFAKLVPPAPGPAAAVAEEASAPAAIPVAAQPEAAAPIAASPSGQYVRVPIERLDELVRFVSELVVSRSAFERHLGAYSQEVRELDLSILRLKRISHRLDTDVEVASFQGGYGQLAVRGMMLPAKADKRQEFDLLEFDRYTDLHLVSRDLSETAVDVTSAAAELRSRAGDFDSYLNRLGRLTSDIQDRLMRMRMVPLASLSTRLHRTVRVTAERTGKQVDFVLEGERVELDKTVLEEMAGPIEHALRNAVDHGIESEALRRAMGKPARGRITLRAHYEGAQVVLTVTDDGAGINPESIRAAAVDRGLVTEAAAAALSDERALDLIFQPGFSTAAEISEVSGRGVGMDIVRSSVARLKGTVELTSAPGRGARLAVRLPMTLAIMRVIMIRAHQETFALPANVVTRILRTGPESLAEVGGRTVLRLDGVVYPVVRLGEALDLKNPPDRTVSRHPALILELDGKHVALLVDEVADAREVVVKTLGSLLRRVHGFTGATLMGDGTVVLILEPAELTGGRAPRPVRLAPAPSAALRERRPLEIMVVDDSISVRRVLAKLIENSGWKATPAKDGLEALEILQRGFRPDAILLDVEMPRMDGYEVLGAAAGMPQLAGVPIVMLTSRSGEKHRKKAFELGATDYLVKPYQDETLLAVLRRVTREAQEAAGVR